MGRHRRRRARELCLWIGYLQWHFRTRGEVNPPEPVIDKFHTIECRDAVLAYDSAEPVVLVAAASSRSGQENERQDAAPTYLTRWDGHTFKKHPVTGEEVPDESATIPVYRYINPRPAEWPEADYIVGNPPYLGARTSRLALGNEYLEALRASYPKVPQNCDYVMYWWHICAKKVRSGKTDRFGLITTKSITQSFCQKLTSSHLKAKTPLSIVFAIPNHPWVDSANGAAIRVALTVGTSGKHNGEVQKVTSETPGKHGEVSVKLSSEQGIIHSNLQVGLDLTKANALLANSLLSCVGYQLSGK